MVWQKVVDAGVDEKGNKMLLLQNKARKTYWINLYRFTDPDGIGDKVFDFLMEAQVDGPLDDVMVGDVWINISFSHKMIVGCKLPKPIKSNKIINARY